MLLAASSLTACAPAPTPAPSPDASSSPSPQVGPPSTEPGPPFPDRGLAVLLECDGPISNVGGLAEDFGPSGGAGNPNAAFAAWLDLQQFAIPRTGYVLGWSDPAHALYVYGVWGEVKVVVLVSTRLGAVLGTKFAVDEVRACDAAEFGTGAVAGQREWRNSDTGETILEIPGHEHCDWQAVRFLDLLLDGAPRQFVRDPLALIAEDAFMTTLDRNISLPDDAFFSGYRSGAMELWLTPADDAAYVVEAGAVERWPRAKEPLGCV